MLVLAPEPLKEPVLAGNIASVRYSYRTFLQSLSSSHTLTNSEQFLAPTANNAVVQYVNGVSWLSKEAQFLWMLWFICVIGYAHSTLFAQVELLPQIATINASKRDEKNADAPVHARMTLTHYQKQSKLTLMFQMWVRTRLCSRSSTSVSRCAQCDAAACRALENACRADEGTSSRKA